MNVSEIIRKTVLILIGVVCINAQCQDDEDDMIEESATSRSPSAGVDEVFQKQEIVKIPKIARLGTIIRDSNKLPEKYSIWAKNATPDWAREVGALKIDIMAFQSPEIEIEIFDKVYNFKLEKIQETELVTHYNLTGLNESCNGRASVRRSGQISIDLWGVGERTTVNITKGDNDDFATIVDRVNPRLKHLKRTQSDEQKQPDKKDADTETLLSPAKVLDDDALVTRAKSKNTVEKLIILFTWEANADWNLRYPGESLKTAIEDDVNAANDSFRQENIPHQLKIAYLGEASHPESNWDKDLDLFQKNGDRAFDEVHELRDRYDADVAILVTSLKKNCGEAASIGTTNPGKAFAALSTDCLRYELTLAHEIGHVHGCRHNRALDSAVLPFKYGHGLIWDDGKNEHRTIMADNLSQTSKFVPIWSDPDFIFVDPVTGISSTPGNETYANNARVWRETGPVISKFEVEPEIKELPDETIDRGWIASATGLKSIENSGNYVIKPHGEATFSSLKKVVLKPGFVAMKGSLFRVMIE